MDALKQAIGIVGTQAELARRLDVKPQQLGQWLAGTRPIPPEHAASIEQITGGVVTARALRPDLARIFAPDAA